MSRMRKALAGAAIAAFFSCTAARAQEPRRPPRPDQLRVFLDCNYNCDETFLKQEITLLDWMRDRRDADVHLLVTTQNTGGGGTEYTLKFIGLGAFAGIEQTLKYNAPQTATADERRKGMIEVIKQGLVRYLTETPVAPRVKVTFGPAPQNTPAARAKDPWNLWVFRTNFGGSFNGERSNKSRSFRGGGSANRTTDAWRFTFSVNGRYSEDTYELSETETFKSVSRNFNTESAVIKSLTQHWSAGVLVGTAKSTYYNYDLRVHAQTGLEYNFFPYSQSTRRMLTVQWLLGYNRFKYYEETIFGKTTEHLPEHQVNTSVSLRQPWGTLSGSLQYSQYLTKPDKYRLSAFTGANIRLFKGFSFNVFGDFSRTHDQIYLARGGATPEEILVRQHQLATSYSYYFNFGLTYSFGSIFNNIVNPRFGGGGGDFFFFE
jgi:hypothetical protein